MAAFLGTGLSAWASYYNSNALLRTLVVFLHVGGLLVAGGTALATDRMTLIAARSDAAARTAQLRVLAGTHRWVLTGLGVILASGLVQFSADTDTFLPSKIFWTKMTLVALLLVNGAWLMRAERQMDWRKLVMASWFSAGLWLTITLAGAALLNL